MTAMKNREYNYLFKMVLVGNSSVGKSSIVLRFADGQFNEAYITTIGVDFRFKSLQFQDKKVKLQIWDTAGQQRFRTITSSYYKGAHAIIITYDITCQKSFDDAVNYWFKEIKNYCPPETEILLIGNKSDLSEQREVKVADVESFVNLHNIQYIETSAKESENIEAAFIKISKVLIKAFDKKQEEIKSSKPKSQRKKRNEGKEVEQAPQEQVDTPTPTPQKLGLGGTRKPSIRGCCPV